MLEFYSPGARRAACANASRAASGDNAKIYPHKILGLVYCEYELNGYWRKSGWLDAVVS